MVPLRRLAPRSAATLLAAAALATIAASACVVAPPPSTTTTSTTTTTPPATIPRYDHVVVVVEENHRESSIIGNANAPYINSLAAGGALFTQSYAVTHPSQPNYLALFSGGTQGVTDDTCPPPGSPYATDNLGTQIGDAGFTFTGYSEDLPSAGSTVCNAGGSSGYYRKHNPWVDFASVPAAANQPFTAFPTDFTTLPTLSFVVPNQLHDMHDGTIAQGDTWLSDNLGTYATWAGTHNSLLIVTWDEDDFFGTNQIATIFYGAHVAPGSYSEHIDHYSVLRTLEDMYGLRTVGASTTATPITDCWA